jgi:hypothetical protein
MLEILGLDTALGIEKEGAFMVSIQQSEQN